MPIVSVFCKGTRRAGAVNLATCATWDEFLAECARLTGLATVDTVVTVSDGEACAIESLDEIDPSDRIEVTGSAPTADGGVGAGQGGYTTQIPSFERDDPPLPSVLERQSTSSEIREWRQAVTRVLERQKSPDIAASLLLVMHHAAVLAKRSAIKWERTKREAAGESDSATPTVLMPSAEDAEALRKAPHAASFLHKLGFRKPVPGRAAGAPEAAWRLELVPDSCVSSISAGHAAQEALDGRHALARLLAMAADAKEAEALPGPTSGRGSAAAATGPAELRGTITPAALAAMASVGDDDLAAARAEVAHLAASARAGTLRPADRQCIVLPSPRARPPCLTALSSAHPALASSSMVPPGAGSAAGQAPVRASAADGGAAEEDDETGADAAAPQSAAEWATVERAHRHRMRVNRTGVAAVRAEKLRLLASSSDGAADGAPDGDGAASPALAGVGSTMRLRLVFPDQVTLVALFGALESCDALRETAGACLADPEQRKGLVLSVMLPSGGTKTLRGTSALALAGLRHRGTVTVRICDAPAAYTKAVLDAVAAGGAAVEL